MTLAAIGVVMDNHVTGQEILKAKLVNAVRHGVQTSADDCRIHFGLADQAAVLVKIMQEKSRDSLKIGE